MFDPKYPNISLLSPDYPAFTGLEINILDWAKGNILATDQTVVLTDLLEPVGAETVDELKHCLAVLAKEGLLERLDGRGTSEDRPLVEITAKGLEIARRVTSY